MTSCLSKANVNFVSSFDLCTTICTIYVCVCVKYIDHVKAVVTKFQLEALTRNHYVNHGSNAILINIVFLRNKVLLQHIM